MKIDTYKIGSRLVDMMPDDDKSCLAYGMIPLKWHELVEKLLKEKIAKLILLDSALGNYAEHEITKELIEKTIPFINNEYLQDCMKNIDIAMLQRSKEIGLMEY